MRPSRERHAIAFAVRCYPSPWRRRHGDDAQFLGFALMDDGVSWWIIFLNFLSGAVRKRVIRKPSVRVGTTVAALLIGVAAVPLALLTSLTPASASSTHVVIIVSNSTDAARQLESAFAKHHFEVTVTERNTIPRLVGSILSVATPRSTRLSAISEVRGTCVGGGSGCIDGLVLSHHFSGRAHVTIGRAEP